MNLIFLPLNVSSSSLLSPYLLIIYPVVFSALMSYYQTRLYLFEYCLLSIPTCLDSQNIFTE